MGTNRNGSNYISTAGGRQYHFAAPTPAMIHIEDIAHALSMQCRFTGHCRRFYSVAEHSVLLSHIVPREYAKIGLLHDATEAYVGDVARPLKNMLPQYQDVEMLAAMAIGEAFGIPFVMPRAIKDADMAMLKAEVVAMLPEHCAAELDLPGYTADVTFRHFSPGLAKKMFLDRYAVVTSPSW